MLHVTLKSGREKPLLQGHPWVFSGAIEREPKHAPGGSLVNVLAEDGRFLGRGYYNSKSQIRVRLLTRSEGERVDTQFWRQRIDAACKRRSELLAQPGQTAARLVMSETDLLPGLIVDRYGDYLVLQSLTAGIDARMGDIIEALRIVCRPQGIIERSDDSVRELEGLGSRSGLVYGDLPPNGQVAIQENGVVYLVDLLAGHKTGYYLDQRQNHQIVRGLARDREVLDCFSFTGGFTMAAAAGGARSVTSVDQSADALARLRDNLSLNHFDEANFSALHGDAFQILRSLVQEGRQYDLVVMDPPKFAANAGHVQRAARGYKDLNLQAFKLLRPGGYLATYSCSGHMSPDLFQKIIFSAAMDAGREAHILKWMNQADDHPVLLSFPESHYLKGLLCRCL
jgi:23S rRNA (cytosine1962-C5)-methyltransferase